CEMPEMDGYEATAAIRRNQGKNLHMPIIAMTAKAVQGDRDRCLAAGMDDYIAKPVRLEDLNAAVERWIPNRTDASAALSEKNALRKTSPVLDAAVTQRLQSLADASDPSLLAEIYGAFLESAAGYLRDMRQACETGETDALRRAVHALKGASSNIGASAVASTCGQLEAVSDSEIMVEARELIEKLERQFASVKIEIQNQIPAEKV